MSDFATMRQRGIGRGIGRGLAVAFALVSVVAVSGQAFAGTARPGSGAAGPGGASTTTTTLPAVPKVPLSLTDGQPAQTLLNNAIELSSVGIDTSALETAIAATQAKMDKDAAAAAKAARQAATVDAEAQAAQSRAAAATSAFDSTDAAMKSAVLFLYTSGPAPLAINPDAGSAALYATDYAESALSPYGVLAARSDDQRALTTALRKAASLQRKADKAANRAASALAAEQAEAQRLQNELKSISAATAAEVTSDHTALADQAGQELLSVSSLQFDPKTHIPPPVSTTPVALTWAFAQLGKQYVWGATGPKTFDCSGLTQFVWRAAGVSIPRVAADQDAWSIPVPLSQLLPGDLVFYGRTDIHHVGVYIGDGLMINAPHTGTVVQVSSIWWSDLAGFGRVHAAGVPVPPHQTPTVTKPAKPVVVPTAKPVPSQSKPPKGWKPTAGSTSPIGPPSPTPPAPSPTTLASPTTTTTTTTTLAPVSTTSVPPASTTDVASTTVPGA